MNSFRMAQIYCSHVKSHYGADGVLQNVTKQSASGRKKRKEGSEHESVCETYRIHDARRLFDVCGYIPAMLTTRQRVMDALLLSSCARRASKQSIFEAFEVT